MSSPCKKRSRADGDDSAPSGDKKTKIIGDPLQTFYDISSMLHIGDHKYGDVTVRHFSTSTYGADSVASAEGVKWITDMSTTTLKVAMSTEQLKNGSEFLLLMHKDKIQGWLVAKVTSVADKKWCKLLGMATSRLGEDRALNLKPGRLLMQALAEICVSKRWPTIELAAVKSAVAFYAMMGFRGFADDAEAHGVYERFDALEKKCKDKDGPLITSDDEDVEAIRLAYQPKDEYEDSSVLSLVNMEASVATILNVLSRKTCTFL